MVAVAVKIQSKVQAYKSDIKEFEESVKNWEEIRFSENDALINSCFDAFNELQMAIVDVKDQDLKKKFQLTCYKETYRFLSYIENNIDEDYCVLLFKHSKPFSKLFKHYSKYCTSIEIKYDIDTPSMTLPTTKRTTSKKAHSKRK